MRRLLNAAVLALVLAVSAAPDYWVYNGYQAWHVYPDAQAPGGGLAFWYLYNRGTGGWDYLGTVYAIQVPKPPR